MSYEEVIALSEEQEVVIIGGGEIYALFLEATKEIHRTIVHTMVEDADTYAPDIADSGFYLIAEKRVPAGEKDDHEMTFQHLIR
jgi:dihydrofolate reductase